MVFYDYPEPGDLTVVITNDDPETGQCIALSDVDFGVAGYEPDWEELGRLANMGLDGDRSAAVEANGGRPAK
ncbi:MAG: hypothetical protein JSV65_15195 [Armatimonadota bacterium]|nr:MAG: hypothetical protein JSV65_15195 [Armatimonadota bacterium]